MSDDHIPLEELGGLGTDLRDEPTSAAARHLAGCATCRARAAGIAATRARLVSLGAAEMPAPVAARIDTVLQAAAAGGQSRSSKTGGDSTVVPLRARNRLRFGRPTWAAAAAVVTIGLAAAAVVIGHAHHHGATTSNGTSATGSTGAHGPALLSGPAHYTVSATGRDYTPGTLRAAVPGLITGGQPSLPTPLGSAATSPRSTISAAVPSSLNRYYRSSSALLSCVATVTAQPDATPLAVDLARWTYGQFHAAPSLVIVIRESPTVVDAYVTGPSCSGTDVVRSLQRIQMPG